MRPKTARSGVVRNQGTGIIEDMRMQKSTGVNDGFKLTSIASTSCNISDPSTLYCRALANIRSIFSLTDATVFADPFLMSRWISLSEIGFAMN